MLNMYAWLPVKFYEVTMKEVIKISRSEFDSLKLLVKEVQYFLEKLEYRFVYEWDDCDLNDDLHSEISQDEPF